MSDERVVESFKFHGAVSDDGYVYIRAQDMTDMFRASVVHYTALFAELGDPDGANRDQAVSLAAACQVLTQEADAVDVAAMDFLTIEGDAEVSPEV